MPVTSLLGLPAELRMQIYEAVFEPDTSARKDRTGKSRALDPLLTCRQIYEEARLLAFSSVIFFTEGWHKLPDRLAVLRPEQVRSIRHLVVLGTPMSCSIGDALRSELFDKLRLRLDSLVIALWHPFYTICRRADHSYEAQHTFESARLSTHWWNYLRETPNIKWIWTLSGHLPPCRYPAKWRPELGQICNYAALKSLPIDSSPSYWLETVVRPTGTELADWSILRRSGPANMFRLTSTGQGARDEWIDLSVYKAPAQ
jgi:hypothetical protein